MPSAEQLRSRLLKKLKELFQLDQPNLQQEGDIWKVRLIEEEFMKYMWEGMAQEGVLS